MKKQNKIYHKQGTKSAAPDKKGGFKDPVEQSSFTSAADRITPSDPQHSWPK